MRRASRLAGLTLLSLLAIAPPAAAAPAPRCHGELWSRPGLQRDLSIHCENTDRVRIAGMPAHGQASGQGFDGWLFRFRLTTDAEAPRLDRLLLDLDGPGGGAQHEVTIHNVPLELNTPPRCEPVETALRTDGTEPAVVTFHVSCWDDEHDDFTLHGTGPGEHLDAPLLVHGGMSSIESPHWRYRTVVSSGPEQTAYWAQDSQGARSKDSPVSLLVGPVVDRPPVCRPNPATFLYDPLRFPVDFRPGVTRRFQVYCEDPDGDEFLPVLAKPPLLGAVTRFEVGEPRVGWWGSDRRVGVTYDPFTDTEVEDALGIVASGPRGAGPLADIRMSPHPLPYNRGSGCGWSGGVTTPGEPVTLTAWCDDNEGDPLSASVVDPPAHGTADEPTVEPEPGPTSYDAIAVRYTPEPGFEGGDRLTVRVGDGNGSSHDLDFSIRVATPEPPPPPVEYTPGPDPDGWHWSPGAWNRRPQTAPPSEGQRAAVSPVDQARRALRTRSVRLVRRLGTALVFARRKPLKPAPRLRALAVTCAVRCGIHTTSRLSGAAAARSRRLRVSPGRARVVVLRLSASERRRIRRARRGRATFRLKARPVTGGRRSGRVALRLRG